MIFYGQNEKQLVFFLDKPVANAISDWNCLNYSRLKLESYKQRGFKSRFQITLYRELNQINEIEIEQVHPKTKQGETFRQCFVAQQSYGLLSSTMLDFKEPRSKPPDNKSLLTTLKLDLIEYFYLINNWHGWTRERALSGRYMYGFGQLDVAVGIDVWMEYVADGWIKDTVTGAVLELYHRYPGEIM
jgi:hypothetical protein